MITKIEFEDKEAVQNDADIPNKNKVTDQDMNEIKTVVNNNATELGMANANINTLQQYNKANENNINKLQTKVSTLETDNTKNKQDITNLNSNKVDKEEGKGLSTEDFTTEYKQKLDGLENYNDTEIKEDIETIQQEQIEQDKDIDKIKSNLINLTAEGKSIHVEDAGDLEAKLEVLGNVEQESREGYNILENTLTTQTVNGITATANKDKSITLNGTATTDMSVEISSKQINLEDGIYTYYLKGKTTAFNLFITKINGDATENVEILTASSTITKKAINLGAITIKSVKMFIKKNTNINNVTVYPMIYKGDEEKEYEQYGASPSPEFPGKAKCLGSNRNIFKDITTSTFTTNGSGTSRTVINEKEVRVNTVNGNPNSGIYLTSAVNEELINLIKGKKATYSFEAKADTNIRLDYGKQGQVQYAKLTQDWQKFSITYNEQSTSASIRFYNNSATQTSFNIRNIKLELGERATFYTPYEQGGTTIKKLNRNIMPINTQEYYEYTEKGIKVVDDYNGALITSFRIKKGDKINVGLLLISKPSSSTSFTFYENGVVNSEYSFSNFNNYNLQKVYMKNYTATQDVEISLKLWFSSFEEFEFQLWAEYDNLTNYVKYEEQNYILNIQKEMLKGDYFDLERNKEIHTWEKLVLDGSTDENWNLSKSFSNVFVCDKPSNLASYETDLICNITNKIVTSGEVLNGVEHGIAVGSKINVKLASINTLEDLKEYLNTTNIEIYYKSTQATELDLTENQKQVLNQLNEIIPYKPITNIITIEDIANLRLNYIADTKTYIDNKFNSVTN